MSSSGLTRFASVRVCARDLGHDRNPYWERSSGVGVGWCYVRVLRKSQERRHKHMSIKRNAMKIPNWGPHPQNHYIWGCFSSQKKRRRGPPHKESGLSSGPLLSLCGSFWMCFFRFLRNSLRIWVWLPCFRAVGRVLQRKEKSFLVLW